MNAPRLTNTRLSDLILAAAIIKDNVEYLDEMLKPSDGVKRRYGTKCELTEEAAATIAAKRESLSRAHAWLEGKVASEREKRSEQTTKRVAEPSAE